MIARNLRLLTLAGLVFLAASIRCSIAQAGSSSTNLNVSATVTDNCTISTADLAFGAYDPIVTNASSPKDSTGTVSITCTSGAVTNVELDLGANASVGTRRMKAGSSYLTYEIYQDSGRTTVWGTNANKLDTGTAPNFNLRAFTAYGRITAGQDIPAGSYTDTVLATVNF
jgi:spore coat protein U-like protein